MAGAEITALPDAVTSPIEETELPSPASTLDYRSGQLETSGEQQGFKVPTSFSASPTITDEDVTNLIQSAIRAADVAAKNIYHPYQSPDANNYNRTLEMLRSIWHGNLSEFSDLETQAQGVTQQRLQGIEAERAGATQKEVADQQRAQQLADMAKAVDYEFGVEGNSGRVADKIQIYHGLKDSLDSDLVNIRQMEGVNFLDDPLQWISNLWDLPQAKAMYNAKATRIDSIFDDIQNSMSAAKDAQELRQREIPSITVAQAAAEANIIAAQATEKAANANMDMIAHSTEFTQQKFAESSAINSAEATAHAQDIENQKLQWMSDVQRLQKSDNDAKSKAILADIVLRQQDRLQIISMLKMAEQRMGVPEGTWNYSTYLKSPEQVKLFVTGQAAGFTGVTPGDTYLNWREAEKYGVRPGPGMNPGTRSMIEYMHNLATSLENTTEFKTITNKEQQNAYIAQKINDDFKRKANNPTFDPPHNPFYEMSPQAFSQRSPSFSGSKVGQLLSPISQGQITPTTDMVVDTLLKGAKNPDEAAAMISDYYKNNVRARNVTNDFGAVGYRPPESYMWQYKTPGMFFNNTKWVDLTNFSDVKRMVIDRNQSADAFKSITQGIRQGPTP